jgi:hypothetical protein
LVPKHGPGPIEFPFSEASAYPGTVRRVLIKKRNCTPGSWLLNNEIATKDEELSLEDGAGE